MSADYDFAEVTFGGVSRQNKYGYDDDDGEWKATINLRVAQEGSEAQYVRLDLTYKEFNEKFAGVFAAKAALEALNDG